MQDVCDKAGHKLNTCCEKIELAMYSLLTLILPEGERDLDAVLNFDSDSGKNTPRPMSMVLLTPIEEEEEDMRPGEIAQKRLEQKKKALYLEAQLLLENYSKKTLSALVRCTKHSLDAIKRRMTSPSTIVYGDSTEKLDHRPAIKVRLVLAVPHIALKPALDEIQANLNAAVKVILATHKHVLQWGGKQAASSKLVQDSQSGVLSTASGILATQSGVLSNPSANFTPSDHQTFFKAVSEHKEVAKLVSLMNSTFSSAKGLVTQSLEQFKHYEDLWTVDRNDYMTNFMKEEPNLSEFEAKMKEYTNMDDIISEEEDLIKCGALALVTGNLKVYKLLCICKMVSLT